MHRARPIRYGSPARSASRRLRAWKSAARIGSMIPRPLAAVQQTSIRVRSSAETWLASRGRKWSPRNRILIRFRIRDTMARRGVAGRVIPTAFRTAPSCASPSSRWPVIKNCMAARRRSSKRLGDRGSGGRGEVFPRRLGAAPGVRQGIREPHPEPACSVRRPPVAGPGPGGTAWRRGRRPGPPPPAPPPARNTSPRARVAGHRWKWTARTSGSARPEDSSTCARLRWWPSSAVGGTWATTASRTRSW